MNDFGFKVWFAFCTALSLATTGVMLWAVIALVQWVTSQ